MRLSCRYLQFALFDAQDQGSVTSAITGPAGTVDFLKGWIGSTP